MRRAAPDANLALTALAIVVLLGTANALFNHLAAAAGLGFPYTSFLSDPGDLFADYFKLLMSYPGGGAARSTGVAGLRGLIEGYACLYGGPSGPDCKAMSNLHLTPLTTLIALANVRLMRAIDPALLFALVNAGLLAWTAWIARAASSGARVALLWTGAAFASYPMLLILTRGNVFAGLAGLAIVAAMLLALERRGGAAAAMLLAVAINIRPNAIIFAAPLLVLRDRDRWPGLVATLGSATAALFAASLAAASALYPAYSIAALRAGIARYHAMYVVQDAGLPYGSSLLGAIKALYGYSARLETAAALVAGLILCGGVVLQLRRRIAASTFLFLVCAAYGLGSSVLGDYHLLVFLAPLLCRGLELSGTVETPARVVDPFPAVLASCLMLAPKNYMFIHVVSYQVVFNPLLLLIVAGMILAQGASLARTNLTAA